LKGESGVVGRAFGGRGIQGGPSKQGGRGGKEGGKESRKNDEFSGGFGGEWYYYSEN